MFKSKYIPSVLFEGMRLKSIDGGVTVPERYVAAQGFIHSKTGRRWVIYFNPLGRRTDYESAPLGIKTATNAWMVGENLPQLLSFGPVGNKASLVKPVETPQPAASNLEGVGSFDVDVDKTFLE